MRENALKMKKPLHSKTDYVHIFFTAQLTRFFADCFLLKVPSPNPLSLFSVEVCWSKESFCAKLFNKRKH